MRGCQEKKLRDLRHAWQSLPNATEHSVPVMPTTARRLGCLRAMAAALDCLARGGLQGLAVASHFACDARALHARVVQDRDVPELHIVVAQGVNELVQIAPSCCAHGGVD